MNNSNEPAYPLPEYPRSNGMSKRERFAMAAMQGLISVNATYNGEENKTALAIDAVAHADELLKQLEDNEPTT